MAPLSCALLLLAAAALPGAPAAAADAKAKDSAADKRPTMESLFLDFSKTQLGPLGSAQAKTKYLYTIQLEKSRLTDKLLRTVYENAGKILSMDPTFQDASILHRAAIELNGTTAPMVSERKLVEDRFEEGLALYRQGRLVEASQRWEETVKLAPGNLKARYWLKKVRGELADEHFRRGQTAYRQHRLRDSLDQWYAALLLNPKYPRLVPAISKAESELRGQEANEKLQRALNLYGQGDTEASLKLLDEILTIEPGQEKATQLIAEIRLEIAKQHVAQGRNLYRDRKYTSAIKEWNRSVEFGYDARRANVLIARARDQMRREAEAKRQAAERKKRAEEQAKADEEQRAKDEEERKKKEAEEAAKTLDASDTGAASAPVPTGPSEEDKRRAIKHWNEGIKAFQQNNVGEAKDHWTLCKRFDAGNADCGAGLDRLARTYGGGL
ncbi:MAG: Tetratricopeptide domain-containing protein [Elusimicrobia bacterium]|nr:MAG: Tetratricopeptide domain-containing protein [Elusimicrobiota bacterium]